MGKYDPDPKRKRKSGHRKGVEPAGLKRWRLAQKRKRRTSGGTKRRYDPGVRSGYRRAKTKARGFLGKIENYINKYAGWMGGLGALIVGVKTGYDTYTKHYGEDASSDYWTTLVGGTTSTGDKRPPEIMHLFKNYNGWTPLKYLKYKFLGFEEESAWVYPFWVSLGTLIACKLPLPFKNAKRIQKPLGKIAGAALAVSTIGALALPGCGPNSPSGASTSNLSPNTHGTTYVYGK